MRDAVPGESYGAPLKEPNMIRLYFTSLALIVLAAVALGTLWISVDRVLAEGEFLWTYVAMAIGVVMLVFAGFLGGLFRSFERRFHS